MRHYVIKKHAEQEKDLVHFDGVFQPGDVALCGQDLIGDRVGGWEMGELTNRRVNCSDCIKIVKAVKHTILSHEFIKTTAQ